MKILALLTLPVCIAAAVLIGVLLALAYYVRAIRGIRLLMSREDRTVGPVERMRARGRA